MPRSSRNYTPTHVDGRPLKITFGEMHEMGVRGVLLYCADYRCSHSLALNADCWPDGMRLSDLEPRFVCVACGRRGADVRPDFKSGTPPLSLARARSEPHMPAATREGTA
ncbi:conserved protein of unknown function [Bradyrhizobium vignae]|uniref:Uncharacterized protein n=1 Tax=Bradyrhizobium vignae TaxID=1549949 RepID=A0A2U3PVJ8_9BRAD|nr:hypothetical protein [Bradyrhizobium vignae]SPP93182.1 conserved protein of unknown function [Bradyrhizobium vignae]